MGISVFEKRLTFETGYFVAFDGTLSGEEEALLEKILLALKWPLDKVQRVQSNVNKGIFFSDNVNQEAFNKQGYPATVIQLPSLRKLLTNVEEKRLAWKKMQPLID